MKRAFPYAMIVVAAGIAIANVVVAIGYAWGVSEFLRKDPRGEAFAGTVIFARPKQIATGQKIAAAEIERYLIRLGYANEATGAAGTFSENNGALEIHPRYRDFPHAVLSFKDGRASAIRIDAGPVGRIMLEPEALAKFAVVQNGSKRSEIRVLQIPLRVSEVHGSMLRDAVVSSEDRMFDRHHGLNYKVALAALAGRGGSTITNQVVRNAILHDLTRSVPRKVRELWVSLALDRAIPKDGIATLYLNNAYFGSQGGNTIYGAGAAAESFFGRRIEDLTLSQAATLAGMLNAPAKYLKSPDEMRQRRDRVLELMAANYPDRYPESRIEQARNEPIRISANSEAPGPAGYFVEDVMRQSPPQPARIYTTLEADLQAAAEQAVRHELRGRSDLQAALVALDIRSGDILALVGGSDFSQSTFDRATQARRSPGSAIKPFVYAAAIAGGTHRGQPFTASTWIDPLHDPVDRFRPLHHAGAPGRARRELAESSNAAAVVAAHDAGLTAVYRAIHAATGAAPEIDGMMAIGGNQGSGVSPLDLASGYTVFANGGLKIEPRSVSRIVYEKASTEPPVATPVRVFDPATAFIVNDMLKSVAGGGPDGRYGTARAARRLSGLTDPNIELRGKTGTGQVGDLWFVGFTPRICVAVWVGSDDNRALPIERGYSGASWALPIWAEFMRGVAKYRPELLSGHFAAPPGVEESRIDPSRGCLTAGSGMEEYFLDGRVPLRCSGKEK